MLEALNRMETLCKGIASFWELESDRFITQGGAIIADESQYVHLLPVMCDIVDEEIRFWKKTKEDILSYAHGIANIVSVYDWHKRVPPLDFVSLRVGEFVFNIPIDIDAENDWNNLH